MYISHSEKFGLDNINHEEEAQASPAIPDATDDLTVDVYGKIIGAQLDPAGPIQCHRREIVGQLISIFYSREDNENSLFKNELRQASTKGEYTSYGIRFRRNGETFFARMDFYAFKNSSGKTIGYRVRMSPFQGNNAGQITKSGHVSHDLPLKLPIPTRNGFLFIDFEDIIRCQSSLSFTNFFLTDGAKIISSKNMGSFEDLLKRANFIRIHKSDIINVAYIKSFTRADGGIVTMIDDCELALSRTYKAAFVNKLFLSAIDK